MTALACASHLLVDLPLFGGPVFFIVAAVLLIRRSERRQLASKDGSDAPTASRAPARTGLVSHSSA